MQKLLTIKEVSDLLQVNQRTIMRMIQNQKIPATKIGNQWRFHPIHLENWILNGANHSNGALERNWELEEEFQIFSPSRVLLDLKVNTYEEALQNMTDCLADEGHLLQPELYLTALLEREAMASTAIGHGVALPHAWHPLNDLFRMPLTVCTRLEHPLDLNSFDKMPVDLLFLLCAPRNRLHLKLLSTMSKIAKTQSILSSLRKVITPHEFTDVLMETTPSLTTLTT